MLAALDRPFHSRYSIGKDKECLEKQENVQRKGHCTLGIRQREVKEQSRSIKVRGRAPVEEGCTWDTNPVNTVLNLKPAFWNQTAAGASPLDKGRRAEVC